MADVTKTIHVRVVTFDPAQGKLIPVPNAKLLCEDSGFLWDPNLSDGNATTDAQGAATVAVTFDEEKEDGLNPFFTITIPAGSRSVPASSPADRRVELPDEWVTRHYAKRRIRRISDHTDPANPLRLFVGLPAHLRVSYTDFDSSGKRNPVALPKDTARVHLADRDTFIFDFLSPDDTLTGKIFDPVAGRIVDAGPDDRYPYFDEWPTAPHATEAPAGPTAWIDPPGAPLGALGGGSFTAPGRLAVDRHGFVFAIDGNEVRRFYPDGTLAETIPDPGGGVFLTAPKGIALDQYGNLYVADTGNHRVRVFEPRWSEGGSGRYRFATDLGGLGNGPGQFNGPEGLAIITNPQVDGPDRLAVADTGNHRVQVLGIGLLPIDLSKSPRVQLSVTVVIAPVLTFGTSGNAPDQFTTPVAVAADRQGRLYVADQGLHRISRWAPDAAGTAYTHQANFGKAGGGPGAGNGELDHPADLDVDTGAGYLYVADRGNRRVQRLDAETGAHLATWTPPGSGAGGQFVVEGVTVDARGEVYAADTIAPRIVRGTRFNPAGAPLPDATPPAAAGAPWTAATGAGHMRRPGYVALGGDRLWVADTGNNRVLAFQRDAAGKLVPATAPSPAGLDRPVGIAHDPAGGLFVADSGNDRIRRYDAALAHQADLGTSGSGGEQLDDPRGIALVKRTEPTLYVADRRNNRVQIVRRDGTFLGSITSGGGTTFSAPEDVATDAGDHLYVADTGNGRIVMFDDADAFVIAFPVPTNNLPPGAVSAAPSGIAVDDEGKLLVADRVQGTVYRLDEDGTVLAFWDLKVFLRMTAAPIQREYEPDLARQLRFDIPTRAVIDDRGLLAVADTGNDRVRLVRTATRIDALLLDLGEGQPDVSFRAYTANDYNAELGLKLTVGDASIFDESHEFVTEPAGDFDDFSDDELVARHVIDRRESSSAAINVVRVVREVQRWFQHHTRTEETKHRWGAPGTGRTLGVDLVSGNESSVFVQVNLGEDGHEGRGSDAWNDSVIAHEMGHWIFFRAAEPLPPFSIVGLLQLTRKGHRPELITTLNQAMNEGWSEFGELQWGSEFGATDRVRGWTMAGDDALTSLVKRDSTIEEHLTGGPVSAAPTFAEAGRGLRSEGYIATFLYQLHRALADPQVLFADAPSFWYRYNVALSDAVAKRFADVVWAALRRFPGNPTTEEWDSASPQYLRGVLVQAHTAQPAFAELTQTLLELNNHFVPSLNLFAGTPTAVGNALGATVQVQPGQAFPFVVRVTDPTGTPLRGYHLRFTVGTPGAYSLPAGSGPIPRHGRRPAPGAAVPANQLNRATNANGLIGLTFTAPATPGATEALKVTYQPDFDTDEALSPPAKGDDRETTLRRAYLHQLRPAVKLWAGSGNNFGAEVAKSITFRIQGA